MRRTGGTGSPQRIAGEGLQTLREREGQSRRLWTDRGDIIVRVRHDDTLEVLNCIGISTVLVDNNSPSSKATASDRELSSEMHRSGDRKRIYSRLYSIGGWGWANDQHCSVILMKCTAYVIQ